MLATINFLISVCCSVSFHTTQFHVGNDRFSTPFPAFGHFYRSHFLPHWNGSVIGSAARLPQIMQCFQAKHRCVWCVWCVCCVWAWLVASEGNVCAQRSETDPPKKSNSKPRQALTACCQTNPPEVFCCDYWNPIFTQHPARKFKSLFAFLKLGAGNGC